MKPPLWLAGPVRKRAQDAAWVRRHQAGAFPVRLPVQSVMRGLAMSEEVADGRVSAVRSRWGWFQTSTLVGTIACDEE